MTDDFKDTTTTEAVAEDWAKVKLPPRSTGPPMAVWITENDGIRTMCGSSQHFSWRSRVLAHPSVDSRATAAT
jgi:hypothetical protein